MGIGDSDKPKSPPRPTPAGKEPSTEHQSKQTGTRRQRPAKQRDRKPKPKWDPASYYVPEKEGMVRFTDLDLPNPLLHAIADLKFQYCTPIQAETLPDTLKGRDATGRAQTGTGKTAAFLITIFGHFLNNPIHGKRKKGTPRALIIAPTRELVQQITKDARGLSKYTHSGILAVFGGMNHKKQREQLQRRVIDVVVATPGRLLDFYRNGELHLKNVEVMVIDEADRMLDMGFIPDVRKIIHATPTKDKRQTLLFSATLPDDVIRLAQSWTRDPVKVDVEPEQVAVDTVDQQIYIITTDQKFALLYNLITTLDLQRVLIFCTRKDDTRYVTNKLKRYNIPCEMLSGDVDQRRRFRRLEDFRKGKIRTLVATDVAGRGIHVEGISHVINYTLPTDPEDYVHRIGRTGRAGASGISISFADQEDAHNLPAIQEYIGEELDCSVPEEKLLELPPPPPKSEVTQTMEERPKQHNKRGDNRRPPKPPKRRRQGSNRSRPRKSGSE